jgi:hypothetical protein
MKINYIIREKHKRSLSTKITMEITTGYINYIYRECHDTEEYNMVK